MGEGGWPGVGKFLIDSTSGADAGVSSRVFRYGTIVGKFNSVDNRVLLGLRDVYSVAPTVFGGASDVPSGDAMGLSGAANSGGFKDKELFSGRSKGRAIEVEGPIELGFS